MQTELDNTKLVQNITSKTYKMVDFLFCHMIVWTFKSVYIEQFKYVP